MSGQAVPLRRLMGWGAVAFLATFCLFIGGSWTGTYDADIRRLTLVLVAVGLGGWLIVAVRDPWWRPQTKLWPGFAAALGVMAITTIMSPFPRLGVEYLAWAVILTCLYLILQRLMASSFFSRRILAFATLCAFIIGIAFVGQILLNWIEWWGLLGRVSAPPLRPGFASLTFGNPSAVMTASVLLTATAVAYLAGGSRPRIVLAIVAVGLSLVVTLLSGSRAGWLALGLAVMLTGALWLVSSSNRRKLAGVARSRSAQVVLLPILIGAIAVAVVAGPGIIVRATAGGDAYRAAYYAASVRMFEASPAVGLGPGSWAAQRTSFTAAPDPDYYIPHAHNVYLQTLAEFGILGLAAGLVVVLLVLRLLYGAVRDPDPVRRRFGWCALFATIYFAGHQLLDFYANAPSILFAFAIPIAWLDATAAPSSPGRRFAAPWVERLHRARGLPAVAGAIAIVVSLGFLVWAEASATTMKEGVRDLDRGDVSAGLASVMEAAIADPAMPVYRFSNGLALAQVGRLDEAEREFLASASIDDLPEAWLNLAAVRARLGDADGYRTALEHAMRLGAQQAAVALGAGQTWLELGDRPEAVQAFAEALSLSPSLAGDPWWTQDPARASIWPDVYATAFDRASQGGRFELALESRDAAAAEAAVSAIADPEQQRISRLLMHAWTGDDAALSELAATARSRPLDGGLVNWLARIHALRGDDLEQRRYEEWSWLILAQANPGARELRIDRDGILTGTSTFYYGPFTYRRPTPLDQFVPWLPDLVAL